LKLGAIHRALRRNGNSLSYTFATEGMPTRFRRDRFIERQSVWEEKSVDMQEELNEERRPDRAPTYAADLEGIQLGNGITVDNAY
jgi:hypothetical protein